MVDSDACLSPDTNTLCHEASEARPGALPVLHSHHLDPVNEDVARELAARHRAGDLHAFHATMRGITLTLENVGPSGAQTPTDPSGRAAIICRPVTNLRGPYT